MDNSDLINETEKLELQRDGKKLFPTFGGTLSNTFLESINKLYIQVIDINRKKKETLIQYSSGFSKLIVSIYDKVNQQDIVQNDKNKSTMYQFAGTLSNTFLESNNKVYTQGIDIKRKKKETLIQYSSGFSKLIVSIYDKVNQQEIVQNDKNKSTMYQFAGTLSNTFLESNNKVYTQGIDIKRKKKETLIQYSSGFSKLIVSIYDKVNQQDIVQNDKNKSTMYQFAGTLSNTFLESNNKVYTQGIDIKRKKKETLIQYSSGFSKLIVSLYDKVNQQEIVQNRINKGTMYQFAGTLSNTFLESNNKMYTQFKDIKRKKKETLIQYSSGFSKLIVSLYDKVNKQEIVQNRINKGTMYQFAGTLSNAFLESNNKVYTQVLEAKLKKDTLLTKYSAGFSKLIVSLYDKVNQQEIVQNRINKGTMYQFAGTLSNTLLESNKKVYTQVLEAKLKKDTLLTKYSSGYSKLIVSLYDKVNQQEIVQNRINKGTMYQFAGTLSNTFLESNNKVYTQVLEAKLKKDTLLTKYSSGYSKLIVSLYDKVNQQEIVQNRINKGTMYQFAGTLSNTFLESNKKVYTQVLEAKVKKDILLTKYSSGYSKLIVSLYDKVNQQEIVQNRINKGTMYQFAGTLSNTLLESNNKVYTQVLEAKLKKDTLLTKYSSGYSKLIVSLYDKVNQQEIVQNRINKGTMYQFAGTLSNTFLESNNKVYTQVLEAKLKKDTLLTKYSSGYSKLIVSLYDKVNQQEIVQNRINKGTMYQFAGTLSNTFLESNNKVYTQVLEAKLKKDTLLTKYSSGYSKLIVSLYDKVNQQEIVQNRINKGTMYQFAGTLSNTFLESNKKVYTQVLEAKVKKDILLTKYSAGFSKLIISLYDKVNQQEIVQNRINKDTMYQFAGTLSNTLLESNNKVYTQVIEYKNKLIKNRKELLINYSSGYSKLILSIISGINPIFYKLLETILKKYSRGYSLMTFNLLETLQKQIILTKSNIFKKFGYQLSNILLLTKSKINIQKIYHIKLKKNISIRIGGALSEMLVLHNNKLKLQDETEIKNNKDTFATTGAALSEIFVLHNNKLKLQYDNRIKNNKDTFATTGATLSEMLVLHNNKLKLQDDTENKNNRDTFATTGATLSEMLVLHNNKLKLQYDNRTKNNKDTFATTGAALSEIFVLHNNKLKLQDDNKNKNNRDTFATTGATLSEMLVLHNNKLRINISNEKNQIFTAFGSELSRILQIAKEKMMKRIKQRHLDNKVISLRMGGELSNILVLHNNKLKRVDDLENKNNKNTFTTMGSVLSRMLVLHNNKLNEKVELIKPHREKLFKESGDFLTKLLIPHNNKLNKTVQLIKPYRDKIFKQFGSSVSRLMTSYSVYLYKRYINLKYCCPRNNAKAKWDNYLKRRDCIGIDGCKSRVNLHKNSVIAPNSSNISRYVRRSSLARGKGQGTSSIRRNLREFRAFRFSDYVCIKNSYNINDIGVKEIQQSVYNPFQIIIDNSKTEILKPGTNDIVKTDIKWNEIEIKFKLLASNGGYPSNIVVIPPLDDGLELIKGKTYISIKGRPVYSFFQEHTIVFQNYNYIRSYRFVIYSKPVQPDLEYEIY